MKTLTVALGDDLYSLLHEHAAMTGRTVNELVTEALDTWIVASIFDDEELAQIADILHDLEETDDPEP